MFHTIIMKISKKAKFLFGIFFDFLYNERMEEKNGLSPQGEREKTEKKRIFETGAVFSVAELFLVAVSVILSVVLKFASEGFAKTDGAKYLSFLLPQISLLAASSIYYYRTKQPVKPQLKSAFRCCTWQYFLIAVLLEFGLLFSLSELNGYFQLALEKIGYKVPVGMVPALDGWNLLPAILVIAVLPAVFEEILFRGIVTRNMQEGGWGTVAVVFVSGALFSIYHGNPSQTIYQFFCGACFAFLAVESGSILPTVLMHFINNALILILSSAFNPVYGENWSLMQLMPLGGYIALLVLSALSLIGTLVYLALFDKGNVVRGGIRHGKPFFTAASIGIAICAIQWIAVLAGRCGWLG